MTLAEYLAREAELALLDARNAFVMDVIREITVERAAAGFRASLVDVALELGLRVDVLPPGSASTAIPAGKHVAVEYAFGCPHRLIHLDVVP